MTTTSRRDENKFKHSIEGMRVTSPSTGVSAVTHSEWQKD